MSKLTYKAEYTCPSCGLGTTVSHPFEDAVPTPPPTLTCPSCGRTAFKTNTLERFYLQTYYEYRCAAAEIINKRLRESEERGKKPSPKVSEIPEDSL